MSVIAMVPGTFDPVTLGHLAIIERASASFDAVVVAVAGDTPKQPWFTASERAALVAGALLTRPELTNVRVDTFDGLLVEYARRLGSRIILKGLRGASDLEHELRMAHTNRLLAPDVETLFVATRAEFSYLSSTLVREVAGLGGDVTPLVPANVVEPLLARAVERERGGHHSEA